MSFVSAFSLMILCIILLQSIPVIYCGLHSTTLGLMLASIKSSFNFSFQSLSMLEFGNQEIHDYTADYPLFQNYKLTVDAYTSNGELITRELGYVPISAKPIFEGLGFRHTSIDYNGQHGALPLDVRQDLRQHFTNQSFDVITNVGFTEHVGENDVESNLLMNQYIIFQNLHNLGHVGTLYFNDSPHPHGWFKHGVCAYQKEFFRALIQANQYETVLLMTHDFLIDKEIMAVYVKKYANEFMSFEEFAALPGLYSRYVEYDGRTN